jgi:hypothetical protein
MAFEITCSELIKNTGQSDCSVDVGFDMGHILVPRGTEIATETAAKTLSTWTTLIQADSGTRIYPLPMSVKQEPTQDEAVYETLSQGAEAYLYTNTSKDKFYISNRIITPQFNINMQALNSGNWACYVVTSNGYIKGKSTDGTKFLPMNCDFRVLPQQKATDAEGAHLPYTVRLDDYEDWNLYGAAVKPTAFNPKTDLEGLLDVDLAVSGTPNATTLVITVATDLNSKAVTGLVLADFVFTDSGTPDSVAEDPDGTYTFTDTDLATGSADLKAPSAMTTTGYESTGSVSWTI